MKLYISLLTAFVTFLLNVSFLFANEANNVEFYNLNEEYGVSIRETNQVLSDHYGFIWISSKMGIMRYTQSDIRTYQLPYDSENIITLRLVYENGILYAYTNNGQIFRYNQIQDKFELLINISKQLNSQYLSLDRILVDDMNNMWLATSFGFFSYQQKSGLKSIDKNLIISRMCWLDKSHFFYATKGGIMIYNITNGISEDYCLFDPGKKYGVEKLFYDRNSKILWVGTNKSGLFYVRGEKGRMRMNTFPEIPHQPVLALESNSDTTLMAGIDGQGIWEINIRKKQVINVYKEDSDNPNSLKGNGVYDLFRDKDNRVWVCTISGGVSYFDQKNSKITEISHIVNNPNSLVNDDVNKVLEDADGNLWFATNNGISYWNISENRWKSFYYDKKEHAQVFLSLCEDNRGRIWAGSYSSGVYIIDRKTGRELDHYSSQKTGGKFNLDYVFDIYKDSGGNIWSGGVSGDLICYLAGEDRFVSLKNSTVGLIREYCPGQMLIGTTYGLIMLDVKNWRIRNLVEGYFVNDFYLKDDVIWLCTGGNGLIRYNLKTKETKNISFDSGLPSNFVNGIASSNGHFWIGTEHGLCRMNENGDSILTYNALPALSNVSINKNSHYNLRNGKLLWGTNKGALIFDPVTIQANLSEGKIFFQDLVVSGRSIRETSSPALNHSLDSLQNLSLKYDQNTISLELIPIGVTQLGSKFSWKLDNFENEWNNPGNNRLISYTNLHSGHYTLRIRMFNSSLTKVIDERSIRLAIIPPFWERLWFVILVYAFIIGLGYFLFTFYIDRLKKQHSEEKIRFFANTAHDIRTSLTLIKGPIEELSKEKSLSDKGIHFLHLASEQAQRLLNIVTQLMDFQKVDIGKEKIYLLMVDIVKTIENRVMMFEPYAAGKNIELKFTTNMASYISAADESMIEKITENLVSNAIKYSFPDATVQVSLLCSPNKWILEVKDQGIGISKKAQKQLFHEYYRDENAVNSKIVGSGIGLLLVKNYVNLHEGKISCISQLNVGSTFQVTIPFKKVNEPVSDTKVSDTSTSQLVLPDETEPVIIQPNDDEAVQKMKVLIVEDNDSLRGFLRSAMNTQFQILIAEDGQDGWELIQKETPDLVVSDILMPRMDGFELCAKLKSTYETSHIPIILLTALAGKAHQLKGLGLGADDYLVKPFDVTLLQQRIKSIIQNRHVIREKALKIIKINDNDAVLLDNELNDRFLKRMVEVVRENIENAEFSKDDFASAMNVSRSLLYRKVKSLTDQSPIDFIKSVRLDHSLDLLKSGKYTITEISELCGFSSASYFSTVFRKHFGKSPTQVT